MPVPTLVENKNYYHHAVRKRTTDLYKIIKLRQTKTTKYTKDDIIRAAREYLITGNTMRTSENSKVHITALRRWQSYEWWPILLEEIKYLKNIELDGQYTNILSKSLAAVLDRLENGDEVVVGKELVRRKVSARDAALISAIVFDKRQLLRGDPTQIQQNNFNIDDRLVSLTEAFETIAKKANEKILPENYVEEAKEDANRITKIININEKNDECEQVH